MAGTEAELYERAAYAKLLGSTDIQEIDSLAQEYWRRHALSWTNSSTAGNMTYSRPLTLSDSLVMSGVFTPSGRVNTRATVAQAADVTLTAADSGKIYRITSNTTGVTVTLPATVDGVMYTFNVVAQGATAADFKISPAAADKIFALRYTQGTTDPAPVTTAAADKDAIFTDASDTWTVGHDSVTLVGDGADGWLAIAQAGVWKVNTNG